MTSNPFAKVVFYAAGIIGLIELLPMYFMAREIGRNDPPAITHPEFFYGFLGIGCAWQIAFLIIGSDPVRFRPMMCAGIVEKVSYLVAIFWLRAAHRLAPPTFYVSLGDMVWAVLFVIAFSRTHQRS